MATQSPNTFIPISDPALQVFEPTVVYPPQGFGTANVTVVEVDQRTTNTYKVTNVQNNPGGTVAQVQYNNGGVFGGDAEFTYNAITNSLTVAGNVISGNFIGSGAGLTGVTVSYATTAGTANAVAGANVSGTVANATYAVSSGTAGTVTTAAQPNVTSVGTLTRVAVVGTATAVGGGSDVGAASTLSIDPAFGSNDWNDPASAQAVRGRVTGSNLTKTHNYIIGATGTYNVTGTNASLFPKVGLFGVIGDTTTTADAAIMAFVDGDSGETRAGAAYGVGMINSTANSGFDYGLDLQFFNSGVPNTTHPFKQADVRLNNGVLIKSVDTAVVDGDATTLAVGTVVLTSHGTGTGLMFISNGSILKQLAFLTP